MRYIVILMLMLPKLAFCQMAHYDSLYNAGLINKADYLVLRQLYSNKPDTTMAKVRKYDSLYASHQITEDEYKALKENLFKTITNVPKEDIVASASLFRQRAAKNTNGGIASMVTGTLLFAAGGIAYGLKSPTASGVLFGFGAVFKVVGIGFLAHSATMRRRAEELEREKRLQLR